MTRHVRVYSAYQHITSTSAAQSWLKTMRVSPKLCIKLISLVILIAIIVSLLYKEGKNDSFHQLMKSRRSIVTQVCLSHQNQIEKLDASLSQILEMPEQSVIWCPVYKAGTTSLKLYLFEIYPGLTQFEKEELWQKHHGHVSPLFELVTSRLTAQRLSQIHPQSVHSFVVVRHPFERLVAAFRDKIETWHEGADRVERDFYYKLYGKKIVEKYRDRAKKRFGDDHFDEDHHFGAPIKPKRMRSWKQPIFWEFVQFVLTQKVPDMDEHWRPIYHYCSFCHVDYDYILKLESVSEEGHELQKILSPDFQKVFHRNHDQNPLTSSQMTQIYFDLLTEDEVNQLYQIYKLDFEMFDYSFQFANTTFPPL